jgi:MFS family permease
MFPVFGKTFGLSYSEMGLLMSVFFVVSGIGQASAGFVVDRFGARPVMFVSVAIMALACLVASVATNYAGLMLAAAMLGIGNCSFHPVDFTILNRRISAPRLGHAFSVHGLSGNLGWAVAPIFMVGIAELSGSWRVACLAAALAGTAVLLLMVLNRGLIDDRRGLWAHQTGAAPAAPDEHPMAFLRLPSVWLCFSFFFW